MIFQRIENGGHYTFWISGIYKVVRYRKGTGYSAFYLTNWAQNWGDYVSPPPDLIDGHGCWRTRRSAMRACRAHQRANQKPTRHQVKRSEISLAKILESHQGNQYAGL